MPIRYKCQNCGATLKIKDELAGKQGKCPKCRTSFRIPKKSDEQPSSEQDGAKKKSGPRLSQEEEEAFRHLTAELGPASGRSSSSEGEYFRDGPTAAADVASELLAKTGRKAQKGNWKAALRGATHQESKAAEAYREYLWEMARHVAMIVLVCVAVGGAGWWLAGRVVGTSRKLPPLGQVTGVVLLNGEPLVGADVIFRPIPPPGEMAPGSASFGRTDENGLYELMYLKDVPGAVVGKHRVEIIPSLRSRIMLPPEYNERSKLVREVKPGRNVINFHIKLRR